MYEYANSRISWTSYVPNIINEWSQNWNSQICLYKSLLGCSRALCSLRGAEFEFLDVCFWYFTAVRRCGPWVWYTSERNARVVVWRDIPEHRHDGVPFSLSTRNVRLQVHKQVLSSSRVLEEGTVNLKPWTRRSLNSTSKYSLPRDRSEFLKIVTEIVTGVVLLFMFWSGRAQFLSQNTKLWIG